MALRPGDRDVPIDELLTSPVEPLSVTFRCDVAYVEERGIVAVRGDVDIATAQDLRREILAVLALPLRGVVLDLGYVTFMDSSGVAVLVAALNDAEQRNVDFRLTSVPRAVRLVIKLSGLTERFGLTA